MSAESPSAPPLAPLDASREAAEAYMAEQFRAFMAEPDGGDLQEAVARSTAAGLRAAYAIDFPAALRAERAERERLEAHLGRLVREVQGPDAPGMEHMLETGHAVWYASLEAHAGEARAALSEDYDANGK